MTFINSESARKAYLGKHAQNLLLKSSDQVKDVYQQRGIVIPVAVSSTLECISRNKGVSLADISKTLNLPHQLVAQRISKLLKLNLAEKRSDPNDKRRSEYFLNSVGEDQACRLRTCMEDMSIIYEDMYKEIGCDLSQMLLSAIDALDRKSLAHRFHEKFPRKKAS